MIFEIWKNDDSATVIEVGDASNRAMEMQEPNSRLVRRIEAASWDMLKPTLDDEFQAVRSDDLNIPAREFQIRCYSNGLKVGDVFEVKQSHRIQLPEGGSVGGPKAGTRFCVVEGDIQNPDLVVMRSMSDEWAQFHLLRSDSHDWSYFEKKPNSERSAAP